MSIALLAARILHPNESGYSHQLRNLPFEDPTEMAG
jgi:hypothetical protein